MRFSKVVFLLAIYIQAHAAEARSTGARCFAKDSPEMDWVHVTDGARSIIEGNEGKGRFQLILTISTDHYRDDRAGYEEAIPDRLKSSGVTLISFVGRGVGRAFITIEGRPAELLDAIREFGDDRGVSSELWRVSIRRPSKEEFEEVPAREEPVQERFLNGHG